MTERHIKSATSSVPVARSRAELERVLRRYGCSAFGFSEDFGTGRAQVHFMVSDDPSLEPSIPVRLEIDIRRVSDALVDAGYKVANGTAERVAWRNLVLWVDSACAAASVNLRPMSETFFADLVVPGPDGQEGRMFDYMATYQKQLLPGGDT